MKQHRSLRAAAAHTARGTAGTAAACEQPREPRLSDTDIAIRAYSYWEARGFDAGSPEEDWYRAIEELTREQSRDRLQPSGNTQQS